MSTRQDIEEKIAELKQEKAKLNNKYTQAKLDAYRYENNLAACTVDINRLESILEEEGWS